MCIIYKYLFLANCLLSKVIYTKLYATFYDLKVNFMYAGVSNLLKIYVKIYTIDTLWSLGCFFFPKILPCEYSTSRNNL